VRFFLPDWDDRIDPGYDFATDRPTYGRDPVRDDQYAHEAFGDESCYDGILVSRSALPEHGAKRKAIDELGLRRYFRLPRRYELMGDCGAFGYVDEPRPIFETPEILEFYQRAGVDYGVSVDHIIFPAFPDQRLSRYQLTIGNALEFLDLHRRNSCSYVPVGAVQGWDAQSYRYAARTLAAAGYRMLAIGGLVRSTTNVVLEIVRSVADEVGSDVHLHLLGVGRDSMTTELLRLGVFSFDSASPIRTAWTSAIKNYLLGPASYTAIRIPYTNPALNGIRGDNILSRTTSRAAFRDLEELEREALRATRAYGNREANLEETIAAVARYDEQQTRRQEGPKSRLARMQRYRRTLRDRPWDKCDCAICRQLGIEIIVFRGNNRNRRRGFHNVRDTYRLLKASERDLRRTTTEAGVERAAARAAASAC
jgi:hypothetical protein